MINDMSELTKDDEFDGFSCKFPDDCDDDNVRRMRAAFGLHEWQFNDDLETSFRTRLEEAAAVGICEALKDVEVEIRDKGIYAIIFTGDHVIAKLFSWDELIDNHRDAFAPGMRVKGSEEADAIADQIQAMAASFRLWATEQREHDNAE